MESSFLMAYIFLLKLFYFVLSMREFMTKNNCCLPILHLKNHSYIKKKSDSAHDKLKKRRNKMQTNNYNNNYYDEDDDIIETDSRNDRPISDKIDASANKKKKNPLVVLGYNIIGILLLIIIAISAFSIVSYCWKDEEQQTAVADIYDSNLGNIYYESGFDSDTVAKMKAHVDTLPDYLKDVFYKDWIVVIDRTIPLRLSSGFVLIDNNDYDTSGLVLGGYTFTQPRIIYINPSLGYETAYTSFVHEVGHFISFEYGSKHGTAEWIKIYEKGYNTLDVSNYDKSNEAEFFASCYQIYSLNPNKLKVYLKEADAYFANLIAKPLDKEGFLKQFFIGCENSCNIMRTYIRLIKY
jgi:hypothetical protein